MMMNKKYLMIGIPILAMAGIVVGYACMYQKIKKPKLDINCLSSDF